MVKGINRFREYFRDFTDQYVLIRRGCLFRLTKLPADLIME